MNVDLLIKENKELSEEKQRYKEMWFTANNSLAEYRKLEEQLGCPLDVIFRAIYSGVAYETKDGLMESEPYVKLYYDGKWFGLDIGDKTWTKIDKDHFKLSDYKKTWWLKEDKSE